ncbi:hypothetical protein [Oceanobacillus saliphilus]|uniref:hypothetical protein n=1 Tax=Oceanobacillus saliphilus TaxID=2925834 RepID=UPI00201E6795|nr:hypothetical protein [Oceanobacillus saliphilus]
MSEAIAGAIFIICLGLGFSIGLIFGSIEVGGAIGFGAGLISIVTLRITNRYR